MNKYTSPYALLTRLFDAIAQKIPQKVYVYKSAWTESESRNRLLRSEDLKRAAEIKRHRQGVRRAFAYTRCINNNPAPR